MTVSTTLDDKLTIGKEKWKVTRAIGRLREDVLGGLMGYGELQMKQLHRDDEE